MYQESVRPPSFVSAGRVQRQLASESLAAAAASSTQLPEVHPVSWSEDSDSKTQHVGVERAKTSRRCSVLSSEYFSGFYVVFLCSLYAGAFFVLSLFLSLFLSLILR